MTARPDDAALSWDGDDDPTLEVGTTPSSSGEAADQVASTDPAESAESTPRGANGDPLPQGWSAVGKGSDAVAAGEAAVTASDSEAQPAADREPMSNAALVAVGILGGFYLLFTIGWVIGGFRLRDAAHYAVADVAFQGPFWLAVLAPVLWFGTVFLLTRGSAAWVRIVWLIAGAILLVPWPFIMVGAVGR